MRINSCVFRSCVAATLATVAFSSVVLGASPAATPSETGDSEPERSPGLLARLMRVPVCFPDTLSDEELAEAIQVYGLRCPAQLASEERFWIDTLAWSGDGGQGASAMHAPAHLTYSFPADSVTWGLSSISATGPNALNASLVTTFGTGNLDLGREYIRQALASWRRYTALTYDEVADNNTACDENVSRTAARGDIRIGGRGFGTNTFLAYNAFPSAAGLAGVGGGDMTINTSFFIAANLGKPDNSYRYLRNVVAHEHGHGLGNIHSVPCDHTKLMEPFINENFEMLQVDDRRGGARNYGDRFAPNHSAATAKDFGNLTKPVLKSIVAQDLSTNGATGPNDTDEDWFKFTLSSTQNLLIVVTPTGATYTAGQQSSSCSGSTSSIIASSAGNLAVSLYLSNGTTLQQPEVNAGAAGFVEALTANGLTSGTYYLRVRDVGPNANQTLQTYDLRIGVGAAKSPPYANAGISKRIAAGATCYFMGDLNSTALDGATLSASSYDWDLDGNGTFETVDNPRPTRMYSQSGVVPVSLRLTDSNGQVTTDTINVVVFGPPTVSSVTPGNGAQGTSVPVTLNGTNLQSVASSGQVTVSGSGVTVSGTPTPAPGGTSVTGLSFVISGGAPLGSRDVTVTNVDGTGVGTGVFSVTATPDPPPGSFILTTPSNGSNISIRNPLMQWTVSANATSYDLVIDDNSDFSSPTYTQNGLAGALHTVPLGALKYRTRYYWTVTAKNAVANTASTPTSFNFRTPNCSGDANRDGLVDFVDITSVLANFGQLYSSTTPGDGDSSGDNTVDFVDVTTTLANWGNSCP